MKFLERAPRHLFFTGKGGVGKTSVACATSIALAERGRRVLLVSTDPASNLDEVLETTLSNAPTPVAAVPGLSAMNIDPEAAAHAYRERMVGPYRGVLPDAAVRSIEEQLSGACTMEIAGFDEFSKLLGDPKATSEFDHVIFDTAPTGHTLRLLELPAAWSSFIATNVGGLAEIISDGATGFIVPPERPDLLANAIVRFYRPGVAAAMAAQVQREKTKYTWENLVRAIEELAGT